MKKVGLLHKKTISNIQDCLNKEIEEKEMYSKILNDFEDLHDYLKIKNNKIYEDASDIFIMKHNINMLLIIILTLFSCGVTYIQFISDRYWFFLYIPLFFLFIMFGNKLKNDY